MKENNNKTCFPESSTQETEHLAHCMCICHSCSKKCLDEGNKLTSSLCAECADICTLTLKAINCHSEFKEEIMNLCAKVCEKCAEECKKMKVEHCQECADVCKKCCDSCSEGSNK